MEYGHFDDKAHEYVVTRPDTPRSWSNYSGNPRYGMVITNNAGGYSFLRSSAYGRFLRLPFNAVPLDQPGRYFYLRDRADGDYWSASWQPVGKPLSSFTSTCRFGTGYTIITSRYRDIESESLYFVPLDSDFEVWRLRVTNRGKKKRNLSLFTYCEFSSEWNIFQDHFNLQYTAFIVEARRSGNAIECNICSRLPTNPDNFKNGDQGRSSFLAFAGLDVVSHDLERESFIGPHRGYHNPAGVEAGHLSGSNAVGDTAVGGLHGDISLAPGETREVTVLLGIGSAADGAKLAIQRGKPKAIESDFKKLRSYWHAKLDHFSVSTPDKTVNSMVNTWNAYNSLVTFAWSRAASLVYSGDGRDGFGYRDTVQDMLGACQLAPNEIRERLILMLSGQESTGGARPEVKAYNHKPGAMPPTPADHYRSDDALWLFNTVPEYVAESGETAFYNLNVPYADKGSATVFGHLRRALEFNLGRMGAHGLPCGLLADWNDCLKLGFQGESVFVAFQLRYGLKVYCEIASDLKNHSETAWAKEHLDRLDRALEEHAWDGKWFVRAFREDGSILGSKSNEEGSIYLNPQSWSIISGFATGKLAQTALDSVQKHLATPYGLALCTPPYCRESCAVVRAVLFNPGTKENGAVFNHTQGWIVMAEAMSGNAEQAWKYWMSSLPATWNNKAEIRQVEPYVYTQLTYASTSEKPGRARVPWLTGAATWAYYAVTHYLLGIRPTVDSIIIDPRIPASWDGFTVTRTFRGKTIKITVENKKHVTMGVASLTLNGKPIKGNRVLASQLLDGRNHIKVSLSK